MAIITTKVGPKYQVTIPKSVRVALKLEAGDLLEVRVAGRDVLLKPKVLVDRDPELEAGAGRSGGRPQSRSGLRTIRRRPGSGSWSSPRRQRRTAARRGQWHGKGVQAKEPEAKK